MIESPDKPAAGAHPDRQTVATINRLVLNLDCCRFIQLIANQSRPVLFQTTHGADRVYMIDRLGEINHVNRINPV